MFRRKGVRLKLLQPAGLRCHIGAPFGLLLVLCACAACGGAGGSASAPASQSVSSSGARMQVSVTPTPPEAGQPATVNISLHDHSGAPVSGAKLIVIEAVTSFGAPPGVSAAGGAAQGGMQPVTTDATEHSAGSYVAEGVQFPSPDSWVITIGGYLADGNSVQATFYTNGSPAGGGAPSNAWVPLVDSIPTGAGAVATGQSLYAANCASCHGATGQGNGPAAAGLIPPPTDLSVHVPMHPDGMLWFWISNGITRTAMPAWKSALSDSQRWDLIAYLRSDFPSTDVASSPTPTAGAAAAPAGPVLQLSVSPSAPKLGPARLEATLKTADGTPIDNATVSVQGTMSAMNMAPVSTGLKSEGGGRYAAGSFPFSMTGTWQLTVTAKLQGGQQVQHTFEVSVK